MWGPDEWPRTDCPIDPKVGGKLRYEWKSPNGGVTGLSGVFIEIDPPKRLVHTKMFDEDWTMGETLVTTALSEKAGQMPLPMVIALRRALREFSRQACVA